MAEVSNEILNRIEAILRSWGVDVEQMLRDAIIRLKIGEGQTVDAKLIQSFKHQVLRGTAANWGIYRQLFKEHGRFTDMGSGRMPTETIQGNNDRLRRRKPKKWYSKTFYKGLNSLDGRLTAMMSQQVINTIKQNIPKTTGA